VRNLLWYLLLVSAKVLSAQPQPGTNLPISNWELVCPITCPHRMPTVGTTFDNFSTKYRDWLCYDDAGNVCINGQVGNTQQCPGQTAALDPNLPIITAQGTTGVSQYCYGVVGCENPSCTRHSKFSAIGCTNSGNAILTNANNNLVSGYADTLYGYRGYKICRTTGGGSQGILTSNLIIGKQMVDNGLSGDSTNCASVYAANNTILCEHEAALPLGNIPPNGIIGVDAPPFTPTIFDDENSPTFGAPGDVNNSFWFWQNQGTATASWSNGTIVMTSDTTASSNLEILTEANPLPPAPYTFTIFSTVLPVNTAGGCVMGFRESSTGKLVGLLIYQQNSLNNSTGGGSTIYSFNATAFNALTQINFEAFKSDGYYLRLQNTGSTLNFLWSPEGDGIQFKLLASEVVTAGFTIAPNQFFIGVNSNATTGASCTFDFERRTQ